MKQVMKVSVGNIAFTLEKEAYDLLDDYLASLIEHYEDNPNADEIVAGIEERIAEIFTDRGYLETVVPANVVREVVSILGNPKDIDEESSSENVSKEKKKRKRKLYRDVEHKNVGGVLSGFASYFSIDVTWLRIIFLALFVVLFFFDISIFDGPSCLLLILAYIILWIAMPAAVTSEQKRELRGESSSISGIQYDIESGGKRSRRLKRNAKVSPGIRVVLIILGSIFVITGALGLIGIILFLFGITALGPFFGWAFSGLLAPITGMATWILVLFKIMCIIAMSMPFVAILYCGVIMIFKLHSPKWRPGLIMFLVWLISILTIVIISVVALRNISFKENVVLRSIPQNDTIYVQFENCELYKNDKIILDASRSKYKLFYFTDKFADPKIVLYPILTLDRDDDYDNETSIRSSTRILRKSLSLNEMEQITDHPFYRFERDTLILSPEIIEKGAVINDIDRYVRLKIGEDVVVIAKYPVYHQFDRLLEFNSMCD